MELKFDFDSSLTCYSLDPKSNKFFTAEECADFVKTKHFHDYSTQSRIKYTQINRNPNNEISNIEISKIRWQFKRVDRYFQILLFINSHQYMMVKHSKTNIILIN